MAASGEQSDPESSASHTRDQGFTMVATLSVVATLAILVTLTLSLSLGTSNPPTSPPAHSTAPTTTTAPQSVGSGATEATVAACVANFAVVNSALQTYRALNGTYPAPGTAWATTRTSGASLLETWPSDPSMYSFTWSGRELSVVPLRGPPAHNSAGSQARKTGCYAL